MRRMVKRTIVSRNQDVHVVLRVPIGTYTKEGNKYDKMTPKTYIRRNIDEMWFIKDGKGRVYLVETNIVTRKAAILPAQWPIQGGNPVMAPIQFGYILFPSLHRRNTRDILGTY